MKQLYIIIIAILGICYVNAQDKIYVHKSNGSIEAIAAGQLDSVSFVTTSANLQLSAEKDTIRVGEVLPLYTNIIENSLMDIAWGTRDNKLISVTGTYTEGVASGLQPGKAFVQASCDGLTASYPVTVIGKATSTGAPKAYWNVMRDYILSGDKIPFIAQYDSKNEPVDYNSVWYDIVEVEDKKATCALIKTLNYVYSKKAISKTIQEYTEYQRYKHDTNYWSDSTQSYLHKDEFSVVLDDTLGSIEWDNPRDTVGMALKIKNYFGENFAKEFKDSITPKLNTTPLNYYAYMEVLKKLSLLPNSTLLWMTDSTFDKDYASWVKKFKEYDSIWSTTNFDTLGVRIYDTMRIERYREGRHWVYDTVYYTDTMYYTHPVLESVKYVYPEIEKTVTSLWRDSVDFLDLIIGSDGYELEYKKEYQINAEYRVYDKEGNYDKTNAHNIVVENKVEKIKITADSDPIIARTTPVTLQIGKYFTNRQGNKHYKWIFPEGTKTVNDEEILSFEGECPPTLIFGHVGGNSITIQMTINGVRLPDEVVNINIGYYQEVPTLYYAAYNGNIMAYKLTNGQHPTDMKILPYDLGVRSGQHPFNILFSDSLLYVLDAGKQFYFVDDVNGVLGDGKISVVAKDGSKVETMISNVGQAAFDDPFYGYIEGDNLFYANRNTGIIKVPLKDRDKMYNATEYPYFVNHNTLGYYNNGIAYGAIGGTIAKINGVWYWAKFYNANGIFRFEESDILPEAITQGDDSNKPASGVLIPGTQPKSFVYASKSQKLCFTIMDTGNNGFYCASIADIEAAGSSKTKLAAYEKKYNGKSFACNTTGNLPAVEGTGSESVGICQMAYDEANDCVYFAYRNNSAQKDLYPATGIYCYNVATESFTCLIEGVSAYGITINNQPSKLF